METRTLLDSEQRLKLIWPWPIISELQQIVKYEMCLVTYKSLFQNGRDKHKSTVH